MAVDPNNDKAIIASSEFDPTNFIKGIDGMTAALERFSAEEDVIKGKMKDANTALAANRAELKATQDQLSSLDKTSKTYTDDLAKLTAQQTILKNQQKDLQSAMKTNKDALTQVNAAANQYKGALQNVATVSKQVAADNKGRSLFDVGGLNEQVAAVTSLGGKLKDVFKGKISTTELDKFEQALAGTGNEMEQLADVVTFVKGKLDTLDPNSEEFAELTQVVQTGEQVLDEYGKTADNTGKKSLSLKGQLRSIREELARLEDQGQENTEEFQALQIAAGKLDDQLGDTQQRIKVLSSDTKNLDFGIGAIRGVASAYGVAEGAAALFGLKNEELAESLQRLNAIMLILNGLQEIQTLLQKQSVVAIVGQEIATKGAAIAQRVYAIAVGTSVGAMRAFRLALIATGIGAFVVLIGAAAEAMDLFGGDTEVATDYVKMFNDELERTNLLLDSQVGTIKFNQAVNEERLKRQGASEDRLSQSRIKSLQKEREATRSAFNAVQAQQEAFIATGTADSDFINKSNQERTALANRIMDLGDQITLEAEKNLTRQYEDEKKARDKQLALYEAYLERLNNLQRELRDKMLAAQPQDEAAIRQTFANSLSDALADLDRDVKSGKLTRGRAGVLRNLLKQINSVDLQTGLKEFAKDAEKAEKELGDAIFNLRIRNGQERAELIRDQFTREADLVRIEARNAAAALRKEQDEAIAGVNATREQGLISPEAAQQNIDRIQSIYAQLLENLAQQTTRKQEEITARMFETTQQELQTVFANVNIFLSELNTKEIQDLTTKYLSGKISYERYQKELTRITREEATKRIATSLRENEALLKGVQERLKAEQDPARLKGLQDQERQLRATIADLKRQVASADAEGMNADEEGRNERLANLAKYAIAIGGIVDQVVQFWSAANQAEQQQLERSIALQERRVDAATRIAERGNAEYLRLEEDRLNELQVKQENAARRQLAINAVLQTSQALVAFVTALAQGIATGGPLGGIAIAASVIGLIAAGYGIITSLQNNNKQNFNKGTKRVRRNGEPSGVDTIPAMLTENEAVIPADTNKAYSPAVAAIYDRSIPAEEMNNFVNNYRVNQRMLPRLDYDRMGEVAIVAATHSSELLHATQEQTRKLDEHSILLTQVNKRLAGMGISFNWDKRGVMIDLMKSVDQHKIDKKA